MHFWIRRILAAALDLAAAACRALLGSGGACRFVPSCSEYARQAVLRDGVLRGGALAVRRLLRCQPLGRSGVDLP